MLKTGESNKVWRNAYYLSTSIEEDNMRQQAPPAFTYQAVNVHLGAEPSEARPLHASGSLKQLAAPNRFLTVDSDVPVSQRPSNAIVISGGQLPTKIPKQESIIPQAGK